MHQDKGKAIRQCLPDRLDYCKKTDKTQEGQLISVYAATRRPQMQNLHFPSVSSFS